jgi:hypothetical protein
MRPSRKDLWRILFDVALVIAAVAALAVVFVILKDLP